MRILSFSTLYPSRAEPLNGVFVRRRLAAIAELAEVRVAAPYARLAWGRSPLLGARPESGFDGALQVLRPAWYYPPLLGGLNPLLLALESLAAVGRLRREFPFELIDAHFGHPDGAAAALLAVLFGVPFTITLRGAEADHAQYYARRRLMGWALGRAGRVFTVSEGLRQLAVSLGAVPERCFTVPNGIDSALFFPRGREEARRRLGIPSDVPVVFSAGHLIELKGHRHILDAVHRLREQGSDARLYIAGGAGHGADIRDELLRLAAAFGMRNAFHLPGATPAGEMPLWFSAADVYCLFSRREGWPNVVNEALACGTPVVAANVGAVPQMIPSPDYGTVVGAGDVAGLTVALDAALKRRWDRPAIARWGQSRSWQRVAREVVDHFAAMMAERPGGEKQR